MKVLVREHVAIDRRNVPGGRDWVELVRGIALVLCVVLIGRVGKTGGVGHLDICNVVERGVGVEDELVGEIVVELNARVNCGGVAPTWTPYARWPPPWRASNSPRGSSTGWPPPLVRVQRGNSKSR